MNTIQLWTNGNKSISIDQMLTVTKSVFDGTKAQIIGTPQPFKSLMAAERYVAKLINIAESVGCPGKFEEVINITTLI